MAFHSQQEIFWDWLGGWVRLLGQNCLRIGSENGLVATIGGGVLKLEHLGKTGVLLQNMQ